MITDYVIFKRRINKNINKRSKYKNSRRYSKCLKDLFGGLLQQILEAELDSPLGYAKHDYQNKNTTNSRNGKSRKTMKANLGYFDLDIPRDREGSFEPEILKKHQTYVSHLESSLIGMYAKGMTTGDIASQVNEI